MRIALYFLIFFGSFLLISDLYLRVSSEKKESPLQLDSSVNTQTPTPETATPSGHSTMPSGHPDIQQAIKMFSDDIKKSPNQPEGYVSRGNAYIANGELRKALSDFSKAIQLAPDNSDYLISRGTIYLRLDDPDHAIADFSLAHTRHPQSVNPLIYRGITLFRSEKYQAALDDFLLILQIKPEFTDAHLSIAQCYHGLGNHQKALEHLNIYRKTSKDPKKTERADALEKTWNEPPKESSQSSKNPKTTGNSQPSNGSTIPTDHTPQTTTPVPTH